MQSFTINKGNNGFGVWYFLQNSKMFDKALGWDRKSMLVARGKQARKQQVVDNVARFQLRDLLRNLATKIFRHHTDSKVPILWVSMPALPPRFVLNLVNVVLS